MSDSEQDWGDSAGARLAEAREQNNHKRFELTFQLMVLGLLCATTVGMVLVDVLTARNSAKDLLIVILPAFTFVLGKMEARENRG